MIKFHFGTPINPGTLTFKTGVTRWSETLKNKKKRIYERESRHSYNLAKLYGINFNITGKYQFFGFMKFDNYQSDIGKPKILNNG